jgi:hypothetical protein
MKPCARRSGAPLQTSVATLPHANEDLVARIVALREEKATLLGQSNFADLTLSRRMAKSGAQALEFITGLHDKVRAPFLRECRELEEYKARQTGRPVGRLAPWEGRLLGRETAAEPLRFRRGTVEALFPAALASCRACLKWRGVSSGCVSGNCRPGAGGGLASRGKVLRSTRCPRSSSGVVLH